MEEREMEPPNGFKGTMSRILARKVLSPAPSKENWRASNIAIFNINAGNRKRSGVISGWRCKTTAWQT
jgi:hypothetical protein